MASLRFRLVGKIMTTTPITVEATLQPDGITLHLERTIPLPPGRVTVTVQPKVLNTGPTMLEMLERIHKNQQQRGRKPMTEAEMATEIAELWDEDLEYEQRWQKIWGQTSTRTESTGNP